VRIEGSLIHDPRSYYAWIVDKGCFHHENALPSLFCSEEKPFNPLAIREEWHKALHSVGPNAFFRLYVHIPFCESKCAYCMFPTDILRSQGAAAKAEEYLEYLASCFRFFSPVTRGAVFSAINIGGGTPSLLSARQLGRLASSLRKAFSVWNNCRFSVEMNPKDVTTEKVTILKSLGCNRVSLGIQSLNAKVLASVNRGHQTQEISERALETLKKAGIEHINCDLLLGLTEDTGETLIESVDAALSRLQPSSVMIYYVERLQHLDYSMRIPEPEWYRHRQALEKAFVRHLSHKKHHGYDITHDANGYEFVKTTQTRRRTGGNDRLAVELMELGLGKNARSTIGGVLEYRTLNTPAVFDKNERSIMGKRISPHERLARQIIGCLSSLERIPWRMMLETQGIDLLDYFKESIDRLTREGGRITVDGDDIRFLATKPTERMTDFLYFLDYGRYGALRNFRRRSPGRGSG